MPLDFSHPVERVFAVGIASNTIPMPCCPPSNSCLPLSSVLRQRNCGKDAVLLRPRHFLVVPLVFVVCRELRILLQRSCDETDWLIDSPFE